MPEIHSKKIDESIIDTLIEDDVVFTGDFQVNAPLAIRGKVDGFIKGGADIYVDKNADISADVSSEGSVFVQGKVKGAVRAVNRVELFTGCSMDGDVTAGRMVIENDCSFNGVCRMNSSGAPSETESEPSVPRARVGRRSASK